MSYWLISLSIISFIHRVAAPCLTDSYIYPLSLSHTGWRPHVLLTPISLYTHTGWRHHILLTHFSVLITYGGCTIFYWNKSVYYLYVTQGRDTMSYWHISLMEASCLTDKQLSIIPILYKGGLLLTLPCTFCLATVCASYMRSACNDLGSTDTSVSGHWVLFKTQSFSTVRWMSQYSEYYLEGCVLCHWTSLILRYFTPGRHNQLHILMSLWCHHMKWLILTLWFFTSRGLNAAESGTPNGKWLKISGQ